MGITFLKTTFVLLIACAILVSDGNSQSYIIGVGDVISITFWQDSELNLETKVGKDGKIILPIGGALQAAGLTTEKLADKIVDTVSLYDRRITTAAVNVVEYESRKVYVMGEVRNPGKYMFEVIPKLWEIILEAGGPTENANLNSVMIIRRDEAESDQSQTIDLVEILRNKKFDLLPEIKPGDNIYVPAVVGNVPSSGMDAMQEQRNVLFIYGRVASAGVYTFNKKLNILEALVTAGGPAENAKLDGVKVIRKIGAYTNVIEVNVERYANESVPAFFMVQGGDAIYVPGKKLFRESVLWNFIMIGASSAITALVVGSLN